MWTYILIFVVLIVLWKLYNGVIKPYQLYNYYKKQFREKKVRTFERTFIPYMAPTIIDSWNDQKNHKDGYYAAKYMGKDYDVVLTNIADQIVLCLISPQLLKQFYLLDGTKTYKKQEQFIRSLKRVVKTTITFTEGQEWKAKRRFMTNFFNFNYINNQFKTVVNIVNRKLEQAAKGRNQFEVYMQQLMQQITSATILQLFFGGGSTEAENLQIEGKKISSYMRVLVEHLGELTLDPVCFAVGQGFPQLNLRSKDRRVTHELAVYNQFASNFVRNRIYEIKEGKSKKDDYVKKIYESVTEQQRTPQFITKVVCDFSSLYIAGTDTTSHSAVMVIYYAIMYPQVRQKLEQQISKHIKSDEDLTSQKVKDMLYLECFIHQCLRLYQPANGIFIRQATEDHLLGDLKIKKGTLVMVSSLTNHYNPENFENPYQFKPERWMEGGVFKTPKPYTWLTFSAGARSCIGKQLALAQLKIIAIQFLRKYNMTMQTQDLVMKLQNFSYQPQKLKTKFVKK